MTLLETIKNFGSHFHLTEECLYDEIAQEVERNIRKDGLWTKALAESGMNEERAKALYIKLRVEQLRAEAMDLISQLKISERNSYFELIETAKRDRQLAASELLKAQELKFEIEKIQIEHDRNKRKNENQVNEKYIQFESDLNYFKDKIELAEDSINKHKNTISELEGINLRCYWYNAILVVTLIASAFFYLSKHNEMKDAEITIKKLTTEISEKYQKNKSIK